jgi:hypothetical protein
VRSGDLEQADQPMLGADSTDTSGVTTATHSRNCSEGVKPPYIQGSSEVRDKLIEDLSSRLSQKLASQFQYNNIQENSENEHQLSRDLEARLPTHQEARLPNNQEARLPTKKQLPAVRRQQVADTKESFEESMRAINSNGSSSGSDEDSGSEFEGPSVALVNYKPRLTSVSSSINS